MEIWEEVGADFGIDLCTKNQNKWELILALTCVQKIKGYSTLVYSVYLRNVKTLNPAWVVQNPAWKLQNPA